MRNMPNDALDLWRQYAKKAGHHIAVWHGEGDTVWNIIERGSNELDWVVLHSFSVREALAEWAKKSGWTKGDLAEWRLPGYTYDHALPQEWLDRKVRLFADEKAKSRYYDEILSTHVWLYDRKAPIGGRPFDLLRDTDEQQRWVDNLPNPIDSRSGVGGSERFD